VAGVAALHAHREHGGGPHALGVVLAAVLRQALGALALDGTRHHDAISQRPSRAWSRARSPASPSTSSPSSSGSALRSSFDASSEMPTNSRNPSAANTQATPINFRSTSLTADLRRLGHGVEHGRRTERPARGDLRRPLPYPRRRLESGRLGG